jgi:VanZ family protein
VHFWRSSGPGIHIENACRIRGQVLGADRAGYHKDLFGFLIAVVVLIVYGSLYPWAFEARHLPASPLYILLHSWDANLQDRRFLFDVAVNIAIYIPLGMSAYLALRRFKSHALEILLPVALGTLLSASIEMAQLFTPHRQCSAVDLVDNILGSVFGVIAGFAFTQIADVPATGPGLRIRDRSAVALLFCWVSFQLFPLFPILSLSILRAKFSAFIHAPFISPDPIERSRMVRSGPVAVGGWSQVAIPVAVRFADAGTGPFRDR